jgi:hypothetical protein
MLAVVKMFEVVWSVEDLAAARQLKFDPLSVSKI